MRRICIVGATSTIAEYCAREWVSREEVELILVGRDEKKLKLVAKDLRVRNKATKVSVIEIDFSKPRAIEQCVADITSKKSVDVALIAQGFMPEQNAAQNNLNIVKQTVDVTATSVVLFAEAFAKRFEIQGAGKLGVIGSVAGDRGRKTNYVYGAAKAFVATYVSGLAHRFAGTSVSVTLIKPGPTRSSMTAHLAEAGARLAEPSRVAVDIVNGIEAQKPVVYTPRIWQIIMMVIRHLPRRIFHRLNV
jgi:short-subunit dehydrogenase